MLKSLAILCLILSFNTFADTKLGIMGSIFYNTSDTEDIDEVDGISEESAASFGIGMRAIMGINDQLHFRSGAGLIQKKWTYEVDYLGVKSDIDASITYLSIPATLYWKASPQVGLFGGTNIQAKLDDDVEADGDLDDADLDLEKVKTVVLPLVLGFDFSFNEQLSMELSYEYGIMDTVEDTKVSSGVLSFVYNLPN